MKIVKIIGGLGNQMFQFALYKALQQRFTDERVLIDLHCFRGYKKHRGFEIPLLFGTRYETATWQQVARIAYPYPNFQAWRIGSRVLPLRKSMLKEKADYAFEPTALTRTDSVYYDGYWQHEDYFSDIRPAILDTFAFKPFTDPRNIGAQRRIGAAANSCAIHIRRGDYVSDKLFAGICNLDYYEAAISRMRQLASPDLFCIFSDDAAWCRSHLSRILGDTPALYADWNSGADSFRDMQLMSLCHHQIIANSSFSWWGAWLNQYGAKTVIGPQKWWNLPDTHSPMTNSWIRI